MGRQGFPSNRIRCFNCGGPHIRMHCPQLKQGTMKAGAAQLRRSRSPTTKVTFQQQDSEAQTAKEDNESDQSTENQVCGACLMYTNTVTYSQATAETALMKTENQVRVSSAASLSEMLTGSAVITHRYRVTVPIYQR